jgi:hypothetical protein
MVGHVVMTTHFGNNISDILVQVSTSLSKGPPLSAIDISWKFTTKSGLENVAFARVNQLEMKNGTCHFKMLSSFSNSSVNMMMAS